MWFGCSSDCRFVKQNSLWPATGQGQAARAKKKTKLTLAFVWPVIFGIGRNRIMSGVSVLSSARHLLVIQPLVGIGDMIWHKPWIDHLARTHKVTLMTKPSVQADVIFEGAPDSFSVLSWSGPSGAGADGMTVWPVFQAGQRYAGQRR